MQMSEKSKNSKEMTIEESFEYLDGILDKLGDDGISLEDSFAAYENGMKVLKSCSEKIDTVEKKVLSLDEKGGVEELGI